MGNSWKKTWSTVAAIGKKSGKYLDVEQTRGPYYTKVYITPLSLDLKISSTKTRCCDKKKPIIT